MMLFQHLPNVPVLHSADPHSRGLHGAGNRRELEHGVVVQLFVIDSDRAVGATGARASAGDSDCHDVEQVGVTASGGPEHDGERGSRGHLHRHGGVVAPVWVRSFGGGGRRRQARRRLPRKCVVAPVGRRDVTVQPSIVQWVDFRWWRTSAMARVVAGSVWKRLQVMGVRSAAPLLCWCVGNGTKPTAGGPEIRGAYRVCDGSVGGASGHGPSGL